MTTLDVIFDLIAAVKRNDTAAMSRLLGELDARLPPEEVIELLETLLGEEVRIAPPPLVACA